MKVKIPLIGLYFFIIPGITLNTSETEIKKYLEDRNSKNTYNIIENNIETENLDLSKKNLKVGVQVGHWKINELPDELWALRRQTGAQYKDHTEVNANLQIAKLVKEKLEEKGIKVDLLPATIPTNYDADLFVSIHADGSENTEKSGYKIGTPYQSLSNADEVFAYNIASEYAKSTGLKYDNNITDNMKGYYSFAWWNEGICTISPYTPAILVETGFITNEKDRKIIVHNQKKAAEGIVNGILKTFAYADTDMPNMLVEARSSNINF